MSRIRIEIEIDDAMVQRVESIAEDSGRSRDDIIEEALKDNLREKSIDYVRPRVQARSEYGDEQTEAVAQAQAEARGVELEARGRS